jgi:Tfp pilus assembly protein PilN
MRAVNLLPSEHQRRTTGGSWRGLRSPRPAVAGALGAALVVATLGLLFVSASGSIDDKQRQVTELRGAQARTEAARTRSSDTPARQQRETAVAAAVSERLAWDVMLTRLARVAPDAVQLSALTLAAPGVSDANQVAAPAGGVAPSDFTITGVAPSHSHVARLLTRLALVPGVVEPQLGSSSKTDAAAGAPAVQFSITAGIDPAEVRT